MPPRLEVTMRLTATDFMTYWRPSLCELRVFLHEKGEPEAEPGAFDEVMGDWNLARAGTFGDARTLSGFERRAY